MSDHSFYAFGLHLHTLKGDPCFHLPVVIFKEIILILFSKPEGTTRITACLTFIVARSVSDGLERNKYIQRHFF